MNTQTFFDNFELLTEAPNGVQKLRELILKLAVRGKLVPQDPNDEPASALLKEIETQKTIMKLRKPIVPIQPGEKFFNIPQGWEWVRLEGLGELAGGATPLTSKSEYWDGNILWVSPKDMKAKRIKDSELKITFKALEENRLRLFPPNCILIVGRSGILKRMLPVLVNDVECTVNQDIKVLIPFAADLSNYLQLMFKGHEEFILKYLVKGGMTVQSLKYAEFERQVFPLPPREEQKRIVAKVDEFMKLCDEMEERRHKKHQVRVHLNNSALEHLLAASTHKEYNAHWQRICDSFDLLYDSPETISKLRQTILHLAVRGKLVQRDQNDEPAQCLLERIRFREKSSFEAKRSVEPLSQIEITKAPFELPVGWAWARFPELGEFGRGKSKHRPRNDPSLFIGGQYKVVQTGDVARSNGVISSFTGLYNDKGLAQSRMWPKGTLCITIAANIADSGILGFDACFPDSIVGFIPSLEIGDARYFEYFMRTVKDNLTQFAPSTAQKNINLGILEQVLIPLPPKRELERIVKRIDQLIKLCDALEAKLNEAQSHSESLMASAVNHIFSTSQENGIASAALTAL